MGEVQRGELTVQGKDSMAEIHTESAFCGKCGKMVPYFFEKRSIMVNLCGRALTFRLSTAVCTLCESELSVPGQDKLNEEEIRIQYRVFKDGGNI